MEITTFHLTLDGSLRTGLPREEAVAAIRAKEGLVWMDVLDPQAKDADFFEQDLGLHPLRTEICINTELHVPTADVFDDYLFINAHGVDYTAESDVVQTTELSIFVSTNYVISSHNVPLYAVASVLRAVERDGRLMRIGPDLLLHALLDELVGNVQPTVDKMLEHADLVEEEALRQPRHETIESVLKLRRSALGLYRVMVSQQGMLNRVARGDFPQVTPKALPYFRDVHEQVWRIVDFTQTLRDRSDSALTTYMSSVANRQNESMRLLSMVAAIFLPLTLLAGVYGMNFEHMPELGWQWAYFAVLGVMGTVIGIMVWAFWARSWIGWGHRQIIQEARRVRPFAVEIEQLAGNVGSRIYRVADLLYPFSDGGTSKGNSKNQRNDK